MNEELIQFPAVDEIKQMLIDAKEDIQEHVRADPDLISEGKLLFRVIDIIDEKISKHNDINRLSEKDKIDIAAHINFLNSLEDDFFISEEEDYEDAEYDEVELDEESDFEHHEK